ncbi:hypothetical protein N5E86_15845 [Stutzerimonas stutzeri]|uniref:hypothetical protein n=1 Tax=Stutzerimonas stutzeri TaxID=316 RepID=UPI00244CA986|nr:hypothetical protein [Stutzerimonas stutzeri]MDH1555926.1 hypothetical protein [Stutzerimonas stutzeri]
MLKAVIHPQHVVGTGRFIHMVTGRIPGDEDDTFALVAAEDVGSAKEIFRAALLDEEDLNEWELGELKRCYGDTVYVTGCHLVGEFEEC